MQDGNTSAGTEQRVMLRSDDIRFVHRRGGARIHLIQARASVRDLRALCGRSLGETPDEDAAEDAPEDAPQSPQNAQLVTLLAATWFPASALCARCVSLARAHTPMRIALQPYTEADRQREQREAAQAMESLLRPER